MVNYQISGQTSNGNRQCCSPEPLEKDSKFKNLEEAVADLRKQLYPNRTYQPIDIVSPLAGTLADEGGTLVNKFISEQKKHRRNPVESFQLYPRSLKLVRNYHRPESENIINVRGEITGFSQASKRRLKFIAANAFPSLISQFAMTYHKTQPDGLTIKKHLHAFLISLKRKFPEVSFLWILEFQTRKTPHFHLFLSLPYDTPGLHKYMAAKWHKLAEPDSPEHLRFHAHKNNFIAWDMRSGSYLCKYLDKEHQKAVPEGFEKVGRFWGNSRNLVPEPITITSETIDNAYSAENIDNATAEIIEFKATEYLVRTLCKHHEKSLKRSKWKSSARTRPTSYTLPSGAIIYQQIENFLENQKSQVVPF